jgi:hypothetical protein
LPGPFPDYGEGFDHKAREPQLAVLFLLVSAFREIQEDLFNATWGLRPMLTDYISMLASVFVDPDAVRVQTEPEDALLVWDSFVAKLRAMKVPTQVENLFARGRAKIQALLADVDPGRYLAEANERARAAVEALATRIGPTDGTVVELAPITISWREGLDFRWPSSATIRVRSSASAAAVSARSAGVVAAAAADGEEEMFVERRIAWVFQHHPSAMWAAMIADVVLQHEYLSHLLPRSDSLPDIVREGWLMWVLGRELGQVEVRVFSHIRYELTGLGHPNAFPGLEEAEEEIFNKRPDLYWGLTRDLLTAPPGPEPAGRAKVVLEFLSRLHLRPLRDFLKDSRLTGLESLYEAVLRQQG